MSTTLLPSTPPPVVAEEGQALKVVQNGFTPVTVLPEQQLDTNVPAASVGNPVVARDTSSIPGISMLAGQSYPLAVYKHDEVVASKTVFKDALNKFHTILGTRLTKKGRGGRERAAEVKTFQESIVGIPKLGGNELDLHLLYVEVTSRGGLEQFLSECKDSTVFFVREVHYHCMEPIIRVCKKIFIVKHPSELVIKDRKWKEVTNCFKFPESTTSASYVLRKYYVGLLYYFEQAYFFGKQGPLRPPPISMPGPSPMGARRSDATTGMAYPLSEGTPVLKRTRKRKILPIQAMPVVDPALSIGLAGEGTIEGKFEHGFLVTVMVGGEKLRGVLYHVPPMQRAPQHATVPNYSGTLGAEVLPPREETNVRGSRRKRRRHEDMPKKDPNAPRPNRTGYNFFFAEQRARLKILYPEKDKELSRMIGDAWNSLTEEEKMPYQERGVKDKERYKREIREYRESVKLQGVVPAELATEHVQEGEKEKDVKDAIVDASVGAAADSTVEAATGSVSDIATDAQHTSYIAMDVDVKPSLEAGTQQDELGSAEALTTEQEDLPLQDFTVSPYVTPKEESFDAEELDEEDLSEGAFG